MKPTGAKNKYIVKKMSITRKNENQSLFFICKEEAAAALTCRAEFFIMKM